MYSLKPASDLAATLMTNRYYHGTRIELALHDLIAPVRLAADDVNGQAGAQVLLTPNLDEAIWSAELADGDAPPRVYVVEALGRIARVSPKPGDPPPRHPRFRGNPTKSFRSREPLRITGELAEWQGHAPEAIAAMKAGLERLKQVGDAVIDD